MVLPQPLTMHFVPPANVVPCAGSGRAATALVNTKGNLKYRTAKSLSIESELYFACANTLLACAH